MSLNGMPHERGRLPYGRSWPHAGSAPAPLRSLAEFLVAPARLVHQTIGFGMLAKSLGGVLLLAVMMAGSSTAPVSSGPSAPSPTLAAGIAPPADPDDLTFLILGVDSMQDRGRSDTVLLIHLMLKQHKVRVMSIPRDSYFVIDKPGGVVEDKLNHSYRFGGAELTKKTVEANLGIKIDYYGVVDYDLFRKAIDLIGCVELDVEKRYYYVDKAGGLKVDLFPGRQQLCGDKALQYVRFRHDAMGDEGRIARQQKFIGAALMKLKDPKIVTYIGFKLPSLLEYVTTDCPSQVAMGLLWKVKDLTAKDLSMASVPGEGKLMDTPIHRQRLWFYVMDKERTERLKKEWFYSADATQETARNIVKGHGPPIPTGPMTPPEESTAPSSSAPASPPPPAATGSGSGSSGPVIRSPFQIPRGYTEPSPSPSATPAAPAQAPAAPSTPATPKPAPSAKPGHSARPVARPAVRTAVASPAPVIPKPVVARKPAPRPAEPAPAPVDDDAMGRDDVDRALERSPVSPAAPASDQDAQVPVAPAPDDEASAPADPVGAVIQQAATAPESR